MPSPLSSQLTNINKKMLLIQQEVEIQDKKGKNDFNNYKYLKENQVTLLIKPLMDKYGVIFEHSSEQKSIEQFQTSKGGTQFLVTVEIIYAFVDAESGEQKTGKVVGWGADVGDKGGYKAITGAIKYLFMKTFQIPTGDDPEKESPELGRKKNNQMEHDRKFGLYDRDDVSADEINDEPFQSKPSKPLPKL